MSSYRQEVELALKEHIRSEIRNHVSLERLRNIFVSNEPELILDHPYVTRVTWGQDVISDERFYIVQVFNLHSEDTQSSLALFFTRSEMES